MNLRNPAAIPEQVPLYEHRIVQFGADFTLDRPAVRLHEIGSRPGRARDDARRVFTGDHRVVDALGSEAVHEASGVTRQQDAPASGTAQGTTHGNQERGEILPTDSPDTKPPERSRSTNPRCRS
jgi:hypothetical protein